jgi:hypothetical protein
MAGFEGRLPSWRMSTVLVQLVVGPVFLVHARVENLANAVAEKCGDHDKDAQRDDENEDAGNLDIATLVA